MNYRILGNSDLSISEVGFGCMSLQPGDNGIENLLHHAIDQGINFFDTADLYDKGINETIVGKALRPHRKKIVLATKVGNEWNPDGKGWHWNPTKDYILKSVDQSLQRLNTDYIDLYQLHGGTIEDPIDDTIEAFESLKKAGKIRHYGISSIRPNVIREYIHRSSIVSVMLQYSLLDRRPEEELLDLLDKNTIGVLARGPLAKGLLINKPPAEYNNHDEATVNHVVAAMSALTSEGRSKTSLALGYVLDRKEISAAVCGIRTENQLRDILQAYQNLPGKKDIEFLKSLPSNEYNQHR
ncbi:MAG: aldo/keto reductase [Chitinophagaceae bacterium]|nr:aldo/keto reductase [Chitinophagaceae bacterium]